MTKAARCCFLPRIWDRKWPFNWCDIRLPSNEITLHFFCLSSSLLHIFCVFFNSFGIITLAKLFCLLVTSRLSMTWIRWCVFFFFCDFHLFCRFFKKFLFQGILSRPKLYWPAVNQQHLCIMSIFSSKMSLTLKARGHNRRQFCCISKFLAEFFRISMHVSFQLVSI